MSKDVELSQVKPKSSSSLTDAKKVDSDIYQLLQSAPTIVRPDAKQLETESEGVLALRLGRNCANILGKLHPDDINSEKYLRRLALRAFDLGLKETLEPKYNLLKEQCKHILRSLHAPGSQERYDYYIRTRAFVELFNEFDTFCSLQGYDLFLMSEIAPKPREFHVSPCENGLQYAVFGLKVQTIPWKELPSTFPQQFSDIDMVRPFYSAISTITLQRGHTTRLQGIPMNRRDQLVQLRQEMHAILDGKLEGKPADPSKAMDYATCIQHVYYNYRQGKYAEMKLTAAELTEGERDCQQLIDRVLDDSRNAALTQLIMGTPSNDLQTPQSSNPQVLLVGHGQASPATPQNSNNSEGLRQRRGLGSGSSER